MPAQRTDIFFKFHDGTHDHDIEAELKQIRSIKGVFNVGALFEGEKDATLKLIHIATTDGSIPAEDVRKAVDDLKTVQYAEYGAKRQALG